MKQGGYVLVSVLIITSIMAIIILTLQKVMLGSRKAVNIVALDQKADTLIQQVYVNITEIKKKAQSLHYSNIDLIHDRSIQWQARILQAPWVAGVLIQKMGIFPAKKLTGANWLVYQVNKRIGIKYHPSLVLSQRYWWVLERFGKIVQIKRSHVVFISSGSG